MRAERLLEHDSMFSTVRIRSAMSTDKNLLLHPEAFVYNLTNWLIKNMPRLLHRRNSWHGRMGSRGQPEESRAAILQAAAYEFAEHGIAGARTDSIAREARVN